MPTPRPKIPTPGLIKGQKARRLSHDFETFNMLDLSKVGSDAYSRSPTCEVLMCGFAINDEEIEQWVPAEGEELPAKLEDAMRDERVIKTCWNKAFEWSIWTNTLKIETPHYAWRDTMALSYSLALPGGLEKAGKVVDLDEDKKKSAEGKALIRTFCTPRKPTKANPSRRMRWYMEPEKWDKFLAYNRQDVAAERAILRKLRVFDMPPQEWELWVIDQIINEAGIPMNMRAVDAAVRLFESLIERGMSRMIELTGLDNPNSGPQLLPWLQDHGYPFDDLKKGHVERALEAVKTEIETYEEEGVVSYGVDTLTAAERRLLPARSPVTETLKEVLEIRQDTSRASPKKYFAIQRCVDRINRVLRNTFQFAGAGRTWRWAGRIFQPQNLPRPEKEYKKIIEMAVRHLEQMSVEEIEALYVGELGLDLMDLIVSCVRAVAQAPEGFLFVDADLNAIENRVLGWIALDRLILGVFERGEDPYIAFGCFMTGRTYADLWHEYKVLGNDGPRTIFKPAVLGCGYQLGPGEEHVNSKTGEIEASGLLGYARNMRIFLTPQQAKDSVAVFRGTYTDVVDAWYGLERAAKKCIRTGRPTEFNMIRFDIKEPFMRMILPSGRSLHYCHPRLEQKAVPWGGTRETIVYEGMNDKNQWGDITTHGGKLMENADQAIARDIIGGGIRRAYYRGLDLRIHVHDQIVGLAPEDEAEDHLRILQECMAEEEDWHCYGNFKLPLASAGHISRVFLKD